MKPNSKKKADGEIVLLEHQGVHQCMNNTCVSSAGKATSKDFGNAEK